MNTKVLEYIVAIAEEQSVSRAAERFYLSHPALSGHLKKLEQELGTPLFQRTGRGMQPTPAGLVFLADARAILHQERKLQQALAVMRQQQRRTIRVMLDMPFYNRFVQRVLPRFTAVRPDYTVDIVKCNASEAREELLQGRAALAVLITDTQHTDGMVYLPFDSYGLRLVFPGSYAGRTDLQGLREALEGGLFLSLYPSGSTTNTIILQRLAAERIYPERCMEGETRTIIEHVKSGISCSVIPEFFTENLKHDGLTVGDRLSPLYHVLAYSTDTVISPAVQDLMQLSIEYLCF